MILKDRHRRFGELFVGGVPQGEAYRQAGFPGKGATQSARTLLRRPEMVAFVAELRAKAAADAGITAAKVLARFWAIATADPNELIEYRRGCCRHCWGKDYRRQLTVREIVDGEASAKLSNAAFDALGGGGFDARKAPNPDCPECFGEGVGIAFAKDSRKLTVAARALYAGVKVTASGSVEILMHDQAAALAHVAKHLGMFVEHLRVGDPDGNALKPTTLIVKFVDPRASEGEEWKG